MSATLRALAGLPTEPVSLAESALILIDCQNTYTRGPMELVGVQAALDQAAELLDRARSAGSSRNGSGSTSTKCRAVTSSR